MSARRDYWVVPGAGIGGRIGVPGDKSISHRAAMLAAVAEGVSRIDGFLESADCLATLRAFERMGVAVEREGDTLRVHGAGLTGLRAPGDPLDVGNSGTSMRLLAGLLAGQRFDTELTGDSSLRRRPMARVIEPLTAMGARIDATDAGTAPLHIHGGARLHGIDYRLPVASAQVKSAVLLAGLYADGDVCVTEPAATRDHTERMLADFGVVTVRSESTVALPVDRRLRATDVVVPGDISSAAFFLVAAAIRPDAALTVEGVGINPTRAGAVEILRAMGADIEVRPRATGEGEPIADIDVRGGGLQGIEIDPALVPAAIDEFPALFVAAACAQGETVLRGAEELRVKESDRIAVMAEGLTRLGIECEVFGDGIRIRGGRLGGGTVESHGDHRVAMAFAVASSAASGPIEVRDCANVDTSFPGFVETARTVGLAVEQIDT